MKNILYLLITATIFSCSKPKEYHVPLDKEFLSCIDFPAGSYWIYRDSVSGVTDSFYIIKNYGVKEVLDRDLGDHHSGDIYYVENLTINMMVRGDALYGTTFVMHSSEKGKYIYSYTLGTWIGSDSVGYSTGGTTILAKADSLDFIKLSPYQVNNFSYTDVIYINVGYMESSGIPIYFAYKKVWWVENIGMIKIIFKDDKVYELVRYYINN